MRQRRRHLLTPSGAAVLAAALIGLPVALAADEPGPRAFTAASSMPRCFGAASRDVVKPCRNASLRYKVIPKPADAVLLPNAPCEPIYDSVPYQCTFAEAPEKANGTIALLGDSHATHWRGALIKVSAAYKWHGVSMTRSGCPFSTAEPKLPGKLKQECIDWRANVYQWFTDHPDVRTVFISQHRGDVVVPKGQTEHRTKMLGFRDAWRLLPDTVKHIVIIRDTPYSTADTDDCVTKALRRREDAGAVCALPRTRSLREDVAAEAAERYKVPGLRLIDMTNYMCNSAVCLPVVGGALTHKDLGHITTLFSDSMGPFLLRKVRALGIKV